MLYFTDMAESLNIISWNVHYPRFAMDSGYVVDAIEKLGPFDVICLQEFVEGGDAKLHEWLDANDYNVTYLPFAHNLEGMSQGVMTATRKVLNAYVEPVVLRKDGPRNFRPFPNIRGLLKATVKVDGESVVLMNFHSTYPRPHVIDMRQREFAELKKLLEHQTDPWVLSGDFNFLSVDKRRKYLTDRYQSFTGGLISKTWRHHSKYTPVRGNLDYFFWSSDEFIVEPSLAPFEESDHRPLLAKISLQSSNNQ